MRLAWILLLASPLAAAPLELSLKRAVQMAVSPEGNTRVQLSAEALKQAESRSAAGACGAAARRFGGYHPYQNLTRNLAAMGSGSHADPGFQIPTFVGPFTTMDARVTASQTVFDFSASAASRRRRWA